jgi:hypothetical protein
MTDERGTGSYNVVATLPDARAARAAADELRRSGFGDDRLSLSSDALTGRSEPDRRARDERIGRRAGKAIWVWGVIGAAVGAVLGVLAAVAFSDVGGTGILVFGVAGAIVLGGAAAFAGGIGSLGDERPSEARVVSEDDRQAVVGIAVATREELDRAVAVVKGSGANAVEVFDRAGNPVHAP